MRLRYENTVDDAIALFKFTSARSPTIKRAVLGSTVVWSVLSGVGVFLVLNWLPGEGATYIAVVAGIGTVALNMYMLPGEIRRIMRKRFRKLYSEGSNKAFLSQKELEIADDGVIARSPYAEGKIKWAAFERVERTEGHTFVFVGSADAITIPHDRILEGDCEAFIAEVQRRIELNKATSKV
jgi:hypothetical protein